MSASNRSETMPTGNPPTHSPRPRDEPIDIAALHERTRRRYPVTMARLREAEQAEEAAKKS
jgi:hypothetical protein